MVFPTDPHLASQPHAGHAAAHFGLPASPSPLPLPSAQHSPPRAGHAGHLRLPGASLGRGGPISVDAGLMGAVQRPADMPLLPGSSAAGAVNAPTLPAGPGGSGLWGQAQGGAGTHIGGLATPTRNALGASSSSTTAPTALPVPDAPAPAPGQDQAAGEPCTSRGVAGGCTATAAASGTPHAAGPSYYGLYRGQLGYTRDMRCPRCGRARGIVPILYGFPSPPLLALMRERLLILGGDHLIEDCHVWGCTG